MRYLILLLCPQLFALTLELTNNLTDEFNYSQISINGAKSGVLARSESEDLTFSQIGGAINHDLQLSFAVFPSLGRYKVNACCGFTNYQLKLDNQVVGCGLWKYSFSDVVKVSIEPC